MIIFPYDIIENWYEIMVLYNFFIMSMSFFCDKFSLNFHRHRISKCRLYIFCDREIVLKDNKQIILLFIIISLLFNYIYLFYLINKLSTKQTKLLHHTVVSQ